MTIDTNAATVAEMKNDGPTGFWTTYQELSSDEETTFPELIAWSDKIDAV